MFSKLNKTIITFILLCTFPSPSNVYAEEPSFICAGTFKRAAKALQGKVSPIGTQHVLVIFTGFKNKTGENKKIPSWTSKLFNPNIPGSLSHFYSVMSGGKFSLKGEILKRRYFSKHKAEYYIPKNPEEKEGYYGKFNKEILEAVDKEVDFSKYDKDGDGYVDFVFIVVKDMPKRFILGPATGVLGLGLDSVFITNDEGGPFGNILITDGSTVKQEIFPMMVGIMAHEYGHALGLPDLYDVSVWKKEGQPPEKDSAGIGLWGLMGYGGMGWSPNAPPNPLSAWSRIKLGWIKPITLKKDTSGVLIGREVYKLPISSTEYFLVSNRHPSQNYYTKTTPRNGLLIWHVDERGHNSKETHKKVDLECADGLYADRGYPEGVRPDPGFGRDNLDFWSDEETYRSKYIGNLGDATDVFDGEKFTSFTPQTNPNSDGYKRTTGIGVENIRKKGKKMSADFRFALPTYFIRRYAKWKGDITVEKDITVAPKAELSIKAGSKVEFKDSGLIVKGKLLIKGTPWSPVKLTSKGNWPGIQLEGDSAKAQINYVILENAQTGISGKGMKGDLVISNSQIKENLSEGIKLNFEGGNVHIKDSQIKDNGSRGIEVTGRGIIAIENSEISGNQEEGVYTEGILMGRIENSRLKNNKDGVLLKSVKGKIYIKGLQIEGNQMGISVENSQAEIVIKNNIIRNNQTGIHTFSSSPQISENKLVNNLFALRCEGSSVPYIKPINSIVGNRWAVFNLTGRQIQAQNNWWGTSDFNKIANGITGPVRWQPYLKVDPTLKQVLKLGQNYPNPFSYETIIPYQIPLVRQDPQRTYHVKITIYNLLGKKVKEIFDGRVEAGFHQVKWNGRNEKNQKVASGVYFCKMKVGNLTEAKKIILSK